MTGEQDGCGEPPEVIEPTPLHLYVIDKDANSHALLFERMLRKSGYNVEVRACLTQDQGLEALDAVHSLENTVILCGVKGNAADVAMYADNPVMAAQAGASSNVWQTYDLGIYISLLKERSRGAKVIVFSGAGLCAESRQAGADGYLGKPVNPLTELVRVVGDVLKGGWAQYEYGR